MEEQGHFISVLEKRSETSFDESQAVQFFQTALAERDEQINALHAQVQACQRSASQLGLEKDELSHKFNQTTAECQRLKERQVQIAEVAFNQPSKSFLAASHASLPPAGPLPPVS